MSVKEFVMNKDLYIAITCGIQTRYFLKEHFEAFLYDLMRNMSDMDSMDPLADDYVDAFEWLLVNLQRIISIQLYDDGEIRLALPKIEETIVAKEIDDDECTGFEDHLRNLISKLPKVYVTSRNRCVFLSEAPIKNRNLDSILYDELKRAIHMGI